MISNRVFVQKADLALSELTSAGGVLQPEQAQKFIRIAIKAGKVLSLAAVTPMGAPKELLEKIVFSSRVLRAGTDGQALTEAQRSKPVLGKVELDAKLFKAQVDLTQATIEDSIERNQLTQTIMQTLAEAIARDMDEVIVQGDTTSADTFLKQFNGMLAGATSHVVNAGTVALSKTPLKAMLRAMPAQFLRDKKQLAFMTSTNAEIDYRDSLADRGTVMGDVYVAQDVPALSYGVPVVDIPMFPENLGGGTNCTNVILTNPKNIRVGIWRQITVETDKDIRAGVWSIVATLRFDFKYEHEDATVKGTNVLAA